MSERGHEITVLTFTDDPSSSSVGGVFRYPRGWMLPRRHAAIVRWLHQHSADYDIVYATGLHTASVAGAKIAGKPVVVKIVGDPAWERGQRVADLSQGFDEFQRDPGGGLRVSAMRWVRNWTVRRADALVTPSEYLASVVRRWVPGRSVLVVQNGVRVPDTVLQGSLVSERNGTLRVIYVGRLVPHKRVEILVDAVRGLRDVELEIVGEGPEEERLRGLADSSGGQVRLLGALSHDQTINRIADADVLANASSYEGLPHVALEALVSGTPLIVSAAGGTTEAVIDGENAIVVQEADPSSFRAGLVSLRDNPDLRSELSSGARSSGAKWDFQFTADKVENLLCSMCNSVL